MPCPINKKVFFSRKKKAWPCYSLLESKDISTFIPQNGLQHVTTSWSSSEGKGTQILVKKPISKLSHHMRIVTHPHLSSANRHCSTIYERWLYIKHTITREELPNYKLKTALQSIKDNSVNHHQGRVNSQNISFKKAEIDPVRPIDPHKILCNFLFLEKKRVHL